jgi:hypothetical protein
MLSEMDFGKRSSVKLALDFEQALVFRELLTAEVIRLDMSTAHGTSPPRSFAS